MYGTATEQALDFGIVTDGVELQHEGERAIVWKQPVHQWRTDVMLDILGRSFLIGRIESPVTRKEVREQAKRWLLEHPERWRR